MKKLFAWTLVPVLSIGLAAAAVQNENWLQEAREFADTQEYEITHVIGGSSDDPQGTWQAPNRAHGFRVEFAPEGIRVVPREETQAPFEFGLAFAGHGRGMAARPRLAAALVPDGPRIEYRRGDLYEWFVNGRVGLKHGFTLHAAPEARGEDTLVRIDLAVTGSLLPVASADGQAIDLVSADSPLAVLHYGGLAVEDAAERTLPSWMKVAREGGSILIRLVFDDAEAVYPVTVDPLLTGPAWQAEGNQTGARFGAAVAGAGDVNCDGYDDVLVAAPDFDAGQTDEGRVFVFHGSPSGLGSTPAWWGESNQPYGRFGGLLSTSGNFGGPVAGAGNINRDGVCRGGTNPGTACTPGAASTCAGGGVCRGCDDVVIGAPGWDQGGPSDVGLAVVYFGSPTGLNKDGSRPVGDPSNADFRIDGSGLAQDTQRGFSVTGTGDTNGDGFGGILVGEPGYSSGKGRVLVRLYAGGTAWTSCEYTWPTNGEYFGHSVAGGGDFDGDGYADVAAAVPRAFSQRGFLVVYFGRQGDGVCRASSHAANTCTTFGSSPPYECWGEIVAPSGVAQAGAGPQGLAFLGNVNGDGYDDLVIGGKAYGAAANKGAVWVYYGRQNPWAGTSNTNRSDWRRVGSSLVGDPYFGSAVSAAGDVNGDGFDDLLMGAPNSDSAGGSDTGSAWLWLGSASGLPSPSGKASEDDAAPYPDWKADGSQAFERVGFSVAGAGDVNGDGFDDLVLGARDYDGDKVDEGRAAAYHGTAGARINALELARHLLETDLPSGSGSMIASAGAVFNAKRCSGGSRVGQFCTGTPPFDCPGGGSCTFDASSPPNFGSIPQDSTTSWSPAVGHGPVPHSVILSTGLALDMGRGNTDLVPLGSADHAQWLFVVKVPGVCAGGTADGQACTENAHCPGGACQNQAKALRFTTQFITSELDRASPKQDNVTFWFTRSGQELPQNVNLDGIAGLGSRRENPPIAHGLSVDGLNAGAEMKLGFLISDKDDGSYDSALIISRMFFSDIPLPAGEGNFVSNPAPQDVGLATGTFTYDKKLYEVPGIGLPFEFSVRYNSASGESDVLGPKWVHSYQASAQKTTVKELIGSCSAPSGWACDTAADCDAGATCDSPTERNVDLLIVRPGTGGAEYFRCRDFDGVCEAGKGGRYRPKHPGTYSTIVEDTVDTKFTYTTKEKVQYVFEQDSGLTKLRLLKSVKDANNNTITLNYTSDKKIDYVLDTRGETFTFNYSDGNLASVEGSGGRVLLAYHGLTGYLKSLTDLNGYATTFAYDERGNLLTLTDADGVTFTTNEYEAYQGSGVEQVGDRVVRRRNARPGDAGTDVSFLGDSLTRTDRVMGKEVERHDVRDRLREKKVLLGTLDTGAACLESDPACWARTETAYEDAGNPNNPTRQIDPLGTTALMSYDALGNLTGRTDASGTCVGGSAAGGTCTSDGECSGGGTCGVRVETDYKLCSAGTNVGKPCGSDTDCPASTCAVTPRIARRGVHPATAGSCQGSLQSGCVEYTYDAQGNLLAETDELGLSVSYGYPSSNNKGLPDRMTDRRGSTWKYVYNSLGQRTSVEDPDPDDAGPLVRPVTRYGYDAMGRVISIWDPLNHQKSFAYDAGGRKTAEWDPLGNVTTYEYDAWGRPTLETDPTGATKAHTYTITGRLEETAEPLGILHRYAYDLEDRLTSETDPTNKLTAYTCDEADRLVAVRDPASVTSSAAYDKAGNLVAVADPRGKTTTFEYDLLNRQTLESDPIQRAEIPAVGVRTEYTPRGEVAESTNARGETVSYTYDPAGRLTGVALPSRTITHVLDANGNRTSTTDPDFPQSPPGPAIERTFDRLDRLTSRRDSFGRTVGYTYDLAGNLVQITYPSGFVVSYAHDAANRLVAVAHPGLSPGSWPGEADASVRASRLQPDGRILVGGVFTTVNGATRIRIARLNADGSLDNTFQDGMAGANGTVETLALQPDGKVLIGGWFTLVNGVSRGYIARLHADGSLDTTFQNEMAGANSGIFSVALQPDGKVLIGGLFTTVNGEIRTRIARLHADGRLDTTFQEGMAGANNFVRTFAVQPDGKVLIGGDFNSFNGMARNYITRLHVDGSLDTTFQDGVSFPVWSVALQPDGKVLIGGRFTTVDGETRNRIARLKADGSLDPTFQNGMDGANSDVVKSVALQPDGKVLIGGDFTSVNGVTRNRIARLNADGSLDTIFQDAMAGASGDVWFVALQPDGKVLIGGDFTSVNGVTRNRIARLIFTGSLDGSAAAYAYDASGKVTGATIPDGSSVTYSYDAARRLVGIADGAIYQATLTRDLAGRITEALETGALAPTVATETSTFAYDDANRLSGAGITNDLDGNLTDAILGGVAATLSYDALNRLVGFTQGGIARTYRYDADGLLVEAVRDGVSTTYVYDVRTGNLLEEYAGTSTTPTARYVWGHGLVGRETSEGWRFYHFDHRGNTVALTDANGAVTDQYAYDPYGRPAGQTGTATNPFKFVGRHGVFDEGNGLFYMRNRHYASELMRFVQKDQAVAGELRNPQSLNRYAYVQGDPIQYIDPEGEFLFIGYEWHKDWWKDPRFYWEAVSVAVTAVAVVTGVAAVVAAGTAVAGGAAVAGGTAVVGGTTAGGTAAAWFSLGLTVVGTGQGVVESAGWAPESVLIQQQEKAAEEARVGAAHDTLAQDAEKERTRPKRPVQTLSPDAPAPCR